MNSKANRWSCSGKLTKRAHIFKASKRNSMNKKRMKLISCLQKATSKKLDILTLAISLNISTAIICFRDLHIESRITLTTKSTSILPLWHISFAIPFLDRLFSSISTLRICFRILTRLHSDNRCFLSLSSLLLFL